MWTCLHQTVKTFSSRERDGENENFHFELYLTYVLLKFFATTKYYYKHENTHSL